MHHVRYTRSIIRSTPSTGARRSWRSGSATKRACVHSARGARYCSWSNPARGANANARDGCKPCVRVSPTLLQSHGWMPMTDANAIAGMRAPWLRRTTRNRVRIASPPSRESHNGNAEFAQPFAQCDQRQSDQRGRVVRFDAFEQGEAESFALEATGAVERLFALDVARNLVGVERAEKHARRVLVRLRPRP